MYCLIPCRTGLSVHPSALASKMADTIVIVIKILSAIVSAKI